MSPALRNRCRRRVRRSHRATAANAANPPLQSHPIDALLGMLALPREYLSFQPRRRSRRRAAAMPPAACQRGKRSPRTGLTLRLSGCRTTKTERFILIGAPVAAAPHGSSRLASVGPGAPRPDPSAPASRRISLDAPPPCQARSRRAQHRTPSPGDQALPDLSARPSVEHPVLVAPIPVRRRHWLSRRNKASLQAGHAGELNQPHQPPGRSNRCPARARPPGQGKRDRLRTGDRPVIAVPGQPQPCLEDRPRWDASPLAHPRRVEAILRLAAQQDQRVVERPDQQRPGRQRRPPIAHHHGSDEDAAECQDQDQAQHPPERTSSTRRLTGGEIAELNGHAEIMAGGHALEERVPISRSVSAAATPNKACPRRRCRGPTPAPSSLRVGPLPHRPRPGDAGSPAYPGMHRRPMAAAVARTAPVSAASPWSPDCLAPATLTAAGLQPGHRLVPSACQ